MARYINPVNDSSIGQVEMKYPTLKDLTPILFTFSSSIYSI